MDFKKLTELTEQEQALFHVAERSIHASSVYDAETVSCLLLPVPRKRNGNRARYVMFQGGDDGISFLAKDIDEAIRIAETKARAKVQG